MSKKRIESWIPAARRALGEFEIEKNGVVDRAIFARISAFGAAVITGRLRSAVAFFAERGNASLDRRKLVSAIYFCIFGEKKNAQEVLEFVYENESPDLKEQFLDALVAIRLAINFFAVVNKEGQDE